MFSELFELLGAEQSLALILTLTACGVLATAVVALFLMNKALTKQLIDSGKETHVILTKLEVVLSNGFARLNESVSDVKSLIMANGKNGG